MPIICTKKLYTRNLKCSQSGSLTHKYDFVSCKVIGYGPISGHNYIIVTCCYETIGCFETQQWSCRNDQISLIAISKLWGGFDMAGPFQSGQINLLTILKPSHWF